MFRSAARIVTSRLPLASRRAFVTSRTRLVSVGLTQASERAQNRTLFNVTARHMSSLEAASHTEPLPVSWIGLAAIYKSLMSKLRTSYAEWPEDGLVRERVGCKDILPRVPGTSHLSHHTRRKCHDRRPSSRC